MKRKALLIEASQIQGLSDLPGARKDVDDWSDFLQSSLGGAWDQDEIEIIRNPTQVSLLLNLRFAKSKDYVFIAFSGHGYHVKGRDVDQTKICLAGKDEVFVSQLNCGAPKMTLVIDSCRQVFHTDEMFEDSYAADSLSKSMRFMDRKAHRDLYDQEVELAPRGIEILYSCDFDESAGESTSGGYFTQGLIRSAGYNNNRNGVLSVEKAFEMAKHYVKIKSIQQNPVFEGGRRIKHFPFAVSL